MTSLPTDHWVKCISTHGNIRGVAIQATELVQSMAVMHQLKGKSARGLGEAVMGALLIASYGRAGQRINLNIQGSGLFKHALVDAYPEGKVRGYVIERQEKQKTEENIGPWGTGFLSVLRTKSDDVGERPYIGTVPLLTGHLAKDLSFYWVQSEQIPTAVGLSVNLKGDKVTAAGGFLVQAMPGADAIEVKIVEQHIHNIRSLAASLKKDGTPLHLLSQIFQSTAFMVVEEKQIELQCKCSWERVRSALALVGIQELQAMLVEDKVAVVHCDFCTQEYRIEAPELEKLIHSTQATQS